MIVAWHLCLLSDSPENHRLFFSLLLLLATVQMSGLNLNQGLVEYGRKMNHKVCWDVIEYRKLFC